MVSDEHLNPIFILPVAPIEMPTGVVYLPAPHHGPVLNVVPIERDQEPPTE